MEDSPLLPVKNKYSLIGYYVSLTGFIPFIGLFGSIAALILGIIALRFENKQHVPGAKAHAIIAIVLGSILAVVHIGMVVMMAIIVATDTN